jgi:Matrixin
MHRFLLLGFALLPGCAFFSEHPGNQYKVYIDPTFTPEEGAVILDALQDWETQVNTPNHTHLSLDPVFTRAACKDHHAICIHRNTVAEVESIAINGGTPLPPGHSDWGVTLYHSFDDNADTYLGVDAFYLDDKGKPSNTLNELRMRSVAEHEIGHAQALQHTPDQTAVMYPYTLNHLVGCGDVAQWRSLRGLPENCE